MNPTESALAGAGPESFCLAGPGHPFGLKIMVVYQDIQSRKRVIELCQRVARSIGQQSFHLRMWSFRELNEAGNFQEAIDAAADADVLIVSLRATEKLHPRFCAWIDAWLARRRRPDGTLIALIDVSGWSGIASEHARNYLRGVAWEARLEFLLREHTASAAKGSFETGSIPTETDASPVAPEIKTPDNLNREQP